MKVLITRKKGDLLKKLKGLVEKPLFGNSRSFSNKATSRKFKLNKQKVTINKKHYWLSVKVIKTIRLQNLFLGRKNGVNKEGN